MISNDKFLDEHRRHGIHDSVYSDGLLDDTGLGLFYGGLARKNNILTIMAQSFLSVGITTIMWVFGGFGLAFGRDIGGIIGNPADFFLMRHVTSMPDLFHGATIPFLMFFCIN